MFLKLRYRPRCIMFTNRTNCTRLVEIFLPTRFVLSISPNHFRFTLTTNNLCNLPIHFTDTNVTRQETIEFGVTEGRTTSNFLCDYTRASFFFFWLVKPAPKINSKYVSVKRRKTLATTPERVYDNDTMYL